MTNNKPRYSAKEDCIIRQDWKAGVSIRDTARKLGRSECAVQQRARNTLNLKRRNRNPPFTAKEDRSICRDWQDGMSTRDIACKLGRNEESVHQRAYKTLNLRRYTHFYYTAEEDRIIRQDWQEGVPVE